jgi:hypothetical protein
MVSPFGDGKSCQGATRQECSKLHNDENCFVGTGRERELEGGLNRDALQASTV